MRAAFGDSYGEFITLRLAGGTWQTSRLDPAGKDSIRHNSTTNRSLPNGATMIDVVQALDRLEQCVPERRNTSPDASSARSSGGPRGF